MLDQLSVAYKYCNQFQITSPDMGEPLLGSPFCGDRSNENFKVYLPEISLTFQSDKNVGLPGYAWTYKSSTVSFLGM